MLASALAPVVQPAEFIAAPKQPQPEFAPAPEVAAGVAVAAQGLPLPTGPALAPQDSAYDQLVAEGRQQQVPLLPGYHLPQHVAVADLMSPCKLPPLAQFQCCNWNTCGHRNAETCSSFRLSIV